MAKRHPTDHIQEFPPLLDRNHFGSWLSGLTDGEGCFYLKWDNRSKARPSPSCRFSISLRADDFQCLELIQRYWKCGAMKLKEATGSIGHPGKPQLDFYVSVIQHLQHIIVPHFVLYPLIAKKSQDFFLWKQAVDLCFRVSSRKKKTRGYNKGTFPKWSEEELKQFASLHDDLRKVRLYYEPQITLDRTLR